jgi:hypothetical protein
MAIETFTFDSDEGIASFDLPVVGSRKRQGLIVPFSLAVHE